MPSPEISILCNGCIFSKIQLLRLKSYLKHIPDKKNQKNHISIFNAKTFENTAKWLRSWLQRILTDPGMVMLNTYNKITWKFNLSRSPWWGGLFESLIGLTKRVLRKILGRARLRFKALQEVVLDVEVIMNNRPLGYIEEDIQLPVLTPNMIIHGTDVTLPEDEIEDDQDVDSPVPPRLAKHVKKCKEALWRRWNDEYVRALREKHDMGSGQKIDVRVGDIVLIKDDDKNSKKQPTAQHRSL